MIIDISQYNTVVDWNEVKRAVDGVIFRIGYRGYGRNGSLVLDKKFHKNLSACHNLGIPYGIYFVTQAVNVTEILEECSFIMEHKEILNPTLGIWIDSEYSTEPRHNGRADKLNKGVRTSLINDFCRFFEERGYKSGLYCSDSWLDDMLNYADLKCHNFWVAKYGKNNGKMDTCPKHLTDLWQFTSKGKVNGIVGDVDLNFPLERSGYLPNLKGYKGCSIVKGLEKYGYDSSFSARKKYAIMLGISNYRGTAEQNLLMIKMLS